jgi:tetratricopeptide (TPR) repeat protein
MLATLAFTSLLAAPQMQHGSMSAKKDNPPVALRSGLGPVHHKVNTNFKKAQQFFDQGLALTYGFNHHASIASFREAARLDPQLAMAHWGAAYAMGMNINMPIDAAQNKLAYEEIQKALALRENATQRERDYIDALARRYSKDDIPDFAKLNNAYSDAMAALAKKYPDDMDAQAFYAESLMDLRPWRLWSIDGMPAPGTELIVSTLQGVLKKQPNHVGANHFLIHAVEASPHPEIALEAARRLEKLAPQSGHLVHMPSHIYIRLGIWDKGIKSNLEAIDVDKVFLEKTPDPGIYPMYYVHNYDMYRAIADMEGNYGRAIWAANNVAEKAGTMGPMGEPYVTVPWLQMARFGKWKDIVGIPAPASQAAYVQAVYRYVRGLSLASTGEQANAQMEYDQFTELRTKVPADYMWGFTPATQVLDVMGYVLHSKLMRARGERATELDLLRKAVAAYDQIGYNEPPDFYYPVRETLGFALLRSHRHADAVAVFKEEVKRHPNSGRAIFGLSRAFLMNGPMMDAERAEEALKTAWKGADTALNLDDM